MELGVILFFLILMIPGCWLILGFRRIVRQREWLDEQQRIEQQRIEQQRINAMSVRRRSSGASSAQGHSGAPVEDAAPAVASTEPALAHEAASGDWSDAQAEDSWQDLNSSHIGTAFESFQHRTTHSSERFTPSQVDDAFEKFRTD
jgi:hypothetical protein